MTNPTVTAGAPQAPAAGPTGRLAQLLDAIRTHGGTWTTNTLNHRKDGRP